MMTTVKGPEMTGMFQMKVYGNKTEFDVDELLMEDDGWYIHQMTDGKSLPLWVTWNKELKLEVSNHPLLEMWNTQREEGK